MVQWNLDCGLDRRAKDCGPKLSACVTLALLLGEMDLACTNSTVTWCPGKGGARPGRQ